MDWMGGSREQGSREQGRVFGFWGRFGVGWGCFWCFWDAKLVLFFNFCRSVTPPRGRWGFGDHSSFVEHQC